MTNNYTNGRGGAFSNLVKKIQNFVNPTTPTKNIVLPKTASVKGANIPKPTANTQPNRGYVSSAPRATTLSTSKPNTNFTTAMPNQQISIQGPSNTAEFNPNGQFTPTDTGSFTNFLRSLYQPTAGLFKPMALQSLSKIQSPITTPLNMTKSIFSLAPSPVRQRAGQGLEDLSGRMGVPFDTGLSELIAGGPTARTKGVIYADSGKSSVKGAQTLDSSNISLTSNKSNKQSKNNMSSVAANNAAKQAELEKKFVQNQNDYNSTINNQGSVFDDGGFALIDDRTQALLDEAAQSAQSQEEYDRLTAEALRKQEEDQFNVLKGIYEGQIAPLEGQVNQQVADQTANIARLERDSNAAKIENENTYGDMIKRLVRNANAQTVKAGNIFSGMGTADSSSFQNVIGDISRTQLEGIGDYEQELGKANTGVTNRLMDAKQETESLINQIKSEGAAKIQAIRNQISLSAEDKNAAISQINKDLASAIYDAQSYLQNKKLELMQLGNNRIYDEYALNQQYNRDLGLQNNEYNQLAKLQSTITPSIPAEAQSAIQGLARKRITPTSSNPEVLQIMQAYGLTYPQIITAMNQYI